MSTRPFWLMMYVLIALEVLGYASLFMADHLTSPI